MKHRHSALIAAAGLVIVDLTLGMGASAGVGAPERRVAAERAGAWTETGRMAFPRSGMEAVLLPNGKVLAIGDGPREDGRPGNSAELYHPRQGRWTIADPMARRRFGHMATVLDDGTVLVAGGDNGHARCATPRCTGQGPGPGRRRGR